MNKIDNLMNNTENKNSLAKKCMKYIKLKSTIVTSNISLLSVSTAEEYIDTIETISTATQQLDKLTDEFNSLLGEQLSSEELYSEMCQYSNIIVEQIKRANA